MADTPLTTGIRFPQDYSIANLTVLSAVGAFDLKNIRVELSYHEDLFNNAASGYVMLTEAMNYIETLQLNGTEFLRVTFSATGAEDTAVDKLFRIYKLDKKKLEGNLNTISYCLYFCSEEMLLNEQYKICKAYPGSTISNNVKDILDNYLQVQSYNVQETAGNYDFIIPTLKPFDAINFMSVYARPANGHPGSDMVFYEDKSGFNFRSLQSLMGSPVYRNYTYNPKNTDPTNLNADMFDVLTYEIMNSFDTLHGINSGAFANQLISADILTRTKRVTNFDYGAYQSDKNTIQLNDYPLINRYKNRNGDETNQASGSMLKLIFSNFNENDSSYVKNVQDTSPTAVAHNIYAETYVPFRTAQLALSNYTRIKVSVPGDSNLTVGLVVGFSLNSVNPLNDGPDKFYSGNYLVTGVRHLISNRYITVLELAKDSVTTPYASPDSTSPTWDKTVKGILL